MGRPCVWNFILNWFLDYFNIFTLCEQFWKNRIWVPFWVPFYVVWVPFWSPFCSKVGPLWVPFWFDLGPLLIVEQWERRKTLSLYECSNQLRTILLLRLTRIGLTRDAVSNTSSPIFKERHCAISFAVQPAELDRGREPWVNLFHMVGPNYWWVQY